MSPNSYERLSERFDESTETLSFGCRSTSLSPPYPTRQRTPWANRFKNRWNICTTQIHIDYVVKAVVSRPWIPYLLVIVASVMAGGGAGYIAAERRQLFANRNYSSLGYCGLTSKDNQGNGCVYDFIIGSWIDSTCHDSKLYAKYVERLRQLNLIYHIDFDGTTEISLDVALRGDHPVIYTTGGHHHLHCSYYWEKQWIAWKYGGTAWDSDTLSDEHTNHCITINGQPRVDELRNGTVIKVSAPEKRIECMTR